jgi:hypothetical protein
MFLTLLTLVAKGFSGIKIYQQQQQQYQRNQFGYKPCHAFVVISGCCRHCSMSDNND